MIEQKLRIAVAGMQMPAVLAEPADAWAVAVVAHGAGAGMRHPFLAGFSTGLTAVGVTTLRFDFPYLAAGRRMPAPPGSRSRRGTPRSSWLGRTRVHARCSRRASRMADGWRRSGRPDRPRTEHLPQIAQPQLFLSGRRDPFVDPHEQLEAAVAACQDATLEWRDGGHSFEVAGRKQPADEIGAGVAAPVIEWMFRQRRSGAATSTPAGPPPR